MERPPKKFVCEKCGYLGDTSEHEGCDYLAWTTGEQLCIDQLERELALLKASPARASQSNISRFIGNERGDKICHEDDGCPTELAVLKRFWREQQASTLPEEVANLVELLDEEEVPYEDSLGVALSLTGRTKQYANGKTATLREQVEKLTAALKLSREALSDAMEWCICRDSNFYKPCEEALAAIDAAMQEDKP